MRMCNVMVAFLRPFHLSRVYLCAQAHHTGDVGICVNMWAFVFGGAYGGGPVGAVLGWRGMDGCAGEGLKVWLKSERLRQMRTPAGCNKAVLWRMVVLVAVLFIWQS